MPRQTSRQTSSSAGKTAAVWMAGPGFAPPFRKIFLTTRRIRERKSQTGRNNCSSLFRATANDHCWKNLMNKSGGALIAPPVPNGKDANLEVVQLPRDPPLTETTQTFLGCAHNANRNRIT